MSESDSSSKIICVCLVLSRHSRKKAGRARHGATAGGQSGEAHGPCGCVGVAASQHIASCLRAIARRRYHGLCLGLSRHSRKNAHTPPPTRAAAAGKSRVALEWARIQPMNHVVSRGQVELMILASTERRHDSRRRERRRHATPRAERRRHATPRAPESKTRADGQHARRATAERATAELATATHGAQQQQQAETAEREQTTGRRPPQQQTEARGGGEGGDGCAW